MHALVMEYIEGPAIDDKEKILAKTEKNQEKIFPLQDKLYADAKEGNHEGE